MSAPALARTTHDDRLELLAEGPWTAEHARTLEQLVDSSARPPGTARRVALDLHGIERLDTFGAWLIERLMRALRAQGCETDLVGVRDNHRRLMDEVGRIEPAAPGTPERGGIVQAIALIGLATVNVFKSIVPLLEMLGRVGWAAGGAILRPSSFRLTSTVHYFERVGWRAVPIILLITFLIGAIIAQQGIFHFTKFGADVYVIDMVGILVLREIGVLIVCIMVAGRSGSAYTAELGTMKMREEIDALETMGFDLVEVLVLPRIVALIIAVPILTFIGSMAALYGGALVSWIYGGIDPNAFVARLRETVTLDDFKVGLIKAPFMALVIGVVAANEGMLVKGSAQSLGQQTTTSVVKSIFLVIVLDGLFAIFFSAIGM